jgi:HPt (histidine-containing phosphotransfer) domain-containing protein
VEDLKKWYRAGLATRIEALKAARRELDGSREPVESVRRIAHTLRGSGATYGFPEITEKAAALEDSTPEAFPQALENLLEIIQEVVARGEWARIPAVNRSGASPGRPLCAANARSADVSVSPLTKTTCEARSGQRR